MKRHAHWMIWLLAFTAATAMAANFSKQNVGSPGGWTGTIAGTYLNGTLYTVESSGSLYATDPANGAWTRLGNPDFANTAFLFGVGGTKGTLYTRMRHPMLWGQVIWAVAHLLVNGDLASIVLFGCLGIWAFIEMSLINGAGPWQRPVQGRGLKGDAMNLVGTLVIIGIAAMIHQWLGHPVFLGNY